MAKSHKNANYKSTQPTQNTQKENSMLTTWLPYIAVIVVLAGVALTIFLSGKSGNNTNFGTTDAGDIAAAAATETLYPAKATWITEYGPVTEDVNIEIEGDLVQFMYNYERYEIANTKILYWTTSEKTINPDDYDEHYDYTITLENDDTVITGTFFEYEDDPACEDSPGLIFWDDEFCYHVAKSCIKYEVHENAVTN